MAIKSMTGYGYGEASAGGIKVQIELSSVNRKQLDVHVNLPKSVAPLESRVVEIIHGAIDRGAITGTVTIHVSESVRRKGVRVDALLAGTYVKEIRKAAARLRIKDDLSAAALLRLPEVVRYEYVEEDVEHVWPILIVALKRALTQLVRMRKAEGAALAADLKGRLEKLSSSYLRQMRKQAPAVADKYRKALQERLARAGFTDDSQDPQVLKELTLFAERCDISEEITRLDSHLQQAFELLKSSEPIGRTLDFLSQEMLREVNTIASKANDVTIVRHVIHFKTELERIREQAQNVE